ncbi:DoxX family protein [Streptomyces sp. OZ13]|uniref:DoxX family protein n=1 Tax=Streptomyces sp. OZ13 TaxID=3452210 RepID=UPI003F88A79F
MNVTVFGATGAIGSLTVAELLEHGHQVTKDNLAEKLPWVGDFSPATVRFIGIVEFAAALGLILPAATGMAPILTPLPATGLAVVMILAAITHARRKENGAIAFNIVLLVLATLVAWGPLLPPQFLTPPSDSRGPAPIRPAPGRPPTSAKVQRRRVRTPGRHGSWL